MVPVPYVPQLNGAQDLRHFDACFTDCAPTLTPPDAETLALIKQDEFDGFEFESSPELRDGWIATEDSAASCLDVTNATSTPSRTSAVIVTPPTTTNSRVEDCL